MSAHVRKPTDEAPTYRAPTGGHPPQQALMTGRAVLTEAYAVLPAGTMRDITASHLPHWEGTRLWVLARPMTGFAETFSQYAMEVAPGGGSDAPDPDPAAQTAIFACEGHPSVTIEGARHDLSPGSFVYVPAGVAWSLRNEGEGSAKFQWIRKRYVAVEGMDPPDPIVAHDARIEPSWMEGTKRRWGTTRFMDPADMRHDFHVTVVTFEPGGTIPFEETHVMEHGLYVLEGKAVYKLNRDWVGGGGGRLHVAARLLPPGLLRGRAGPLPLPALQGREPPRRAHAVRAGSRRGGSAWPLYPAPLRGGAPPWTLGASHRRDPANARVRLGVAHAPRTKRHGGSNECS